jgi:hypothetical protein
MHTVFTSRVLLVHSQVSQQYILVLSLSIVEYCNITGTLYVQVYNTIRDCDMSGWPTLNNDAIFVTISSTNLLGKKILLLVLCRTSEWALIQSETSPRTLLNDRS